MIKTTIQNRLFKITTNKKTYTVNAPNKVSLYAQSGGIDYANMTLDTSPADADVVPVNGTRNSVLSQLKISLANIKSYVLGTLFNTSSGHDHDGSNSKQIAYANLTGTPAFETSTSNIKADGAAAVGSLSTVPRADHVHPDGDTGWITATLINGWASYNSSIGLKYKKVGKVVTVHWLLTPSSATSNIVAVLPSGYRPVGGGYCGAHGANMSTPECYFIEANGEISFIGYNTTWNYYRGYATFLVD